MSSEPTLMVTDGAVQRSFVDKKLSLKSLEWSGVGGGVARWQQTVRLLCWCGSRISCFDGSGLRLMLHAPPPHFKSYYLLTYLLRL